MVDKHLKWNNLGSSSPNLKICLVFLILTIITQSTTDFCAVTKSHEIVGLVNQQTYTIPLGNYIKGYNLKFQSDNIVSARVWNPVQFIGSTTFSFDQGYKLINVDILQSSNKKWNRNAVMFTQKDNQNIALAIFGLSGAKSFAQSTTYQKYKLPQNSTCYSAQVVDTKSNVVIDCQTNDGSQDLICFINTQSKSILCNSIDSLNQVLNRKSQTFVIGGQTYLITGTYQKDKMTKEMTYLTLYHVDSESGSVDFVNIIDGYQLGLDYDIVISDFDVTQNGNILISDIAKSQILRVEYKLPNEISLVGEPWVYGTDGHELQVTSKNTVLIATHSNVEEYCLTKQQKIFNYELDKVDNQVTDIIVSSYGVSVVTMKDSKQYLSVYQRESGNFNYLLAKIQITRRAPMMAPYSNALYLFEDHEQAIHEVSSGWLILQKVSEDTTATITATSTSLNCKFTLQLSHVSSVDKILIKQNITNKHFKRESNQPITLNLQEIYSGQNLNYELPQSTNQIKFSLQQLNSYKIHSTVDNVLITQVINTDKHSFVMLSVTADGYVMENCKVNEQGAMLVYCEVIKNDKLIDNRDTKPLIASGKLRKSGEYIFVWTYSGDVHYKISYKDQKAYGYQRSFVGSRFDISSINIAEDRIYLVYKKFSQIRVIFDLQPSYPDFSINTKNFNPAFYNIVGFYPRDIMLHPHDKDLFFVKFPQHVCLMTMIGSSPHTIQCQQLFQTVIPEQKWTVVIGDNSYVVITQTGLQQIAFIGIMPRSLHTAVLKSAFTLPVHYSPETNSIVFKTVKNTIVYYKLSKTLLDSVYYEVPVQQANEINQQTVPLTTQGYWTISLTDMKAYRQSNSSKLTIDAVGDRKSLKQDIKFSLKVKGASDQVDTDNDITVITYPTEIKSTTQPDILKLPLKGQGKRIQINPDKYFNGTRSTYHIVCEYCQKEIFLETAFKEQQQNKEIIGARSMLEFGTNGNVLILTDNRLILVDNKTTTIAYKVIQHIKKCKQMVWNKNYGLLVLCEDQTGQQMLVFQVTQDQITQTAKSYPLPEQALINSVNQMISVDIDVNSAWLMVLDNDITQVKQSIKKSADVKVFIWTQDSLQFKGVLTSKSFGLQSLQPINDIDIGNNRVIFATLGNHGFGYAMLSQNRQSISPLQNAKLFNLSSVQSLANYVVDDSIYQQIEITSSSDKSVQLLITSSSSLPMILEFSYNDKSNLLFSQLKQVFNRYGTLDLINWHQITASSLLLSYYNAQTHEQYITYYIRPTQASDKIIDIAQTKTISIKQNQLQEHSVLLTTQDIVIISSAATTQADDSFIMSYLLTSEYNLVLNYTKAGTFNTIQFAVSNLYSSNNNKIAVQFQVQPTPTPDDNGIKWYTIMIIILIVLIIVGVAYGMYLKMIKHRKDKTVSLLSEGQAEDQVV